MVWAPGKTLLVTSYCLFQCHFLLQPLLMMSTSQKRLSLMVSILTTISIHLDSLPSLTFRHHVFYIQDRRTASPHKGTMHPIYRTDVPLLLTQPPRILCIGQTYRYSPHSHHASYIQDRRTATPHIATTHPIYRTDVPLLPTQEPCILYIEQTYRYSPHSHHASYIQDRRTAPPQSRLFIYLVNKYI